MPCPRESNRHAHHPLLRQIHFAGDRSDRKEAALSFLSRKPDPFSRNGRMQSDLHLLPELADFAVGDPRREPLLYGAGAPCRSGGRPPDAGRGVHLQRAVDLGGIRNRCGPGVPAAGAAYGGRHQRPYRGKGARRFLRRDGRGEHRPEGVYRRVLSGFVRRKPERRQSDAPLRGQRDRCLGGGHQPDHSRTERQ